MIPWKHARTLIAPLVLLFSALLPPSAGAARDPISASAHVSPHSIRVGERATLEITIVTPPDHRVLPFALPQDLRDLEVELAESLPVDERDARWTHSIRVRFRPRDVGKLAWPKTVLEIETPNGETETRSIESVPFEVTSVLHRYAGQSEPFGARQAPPLPSEGLAPARVALGVVFAVMLLAFLFFRNRRVSPTAPPVTAAASDKPWTIALRDLGNATDAADPCEAAATTAATLRRYMERRFGAPTRARTSEELAEAIPPFGATSRWPAFTALLLELDAIRFSPRSGSRHASTESGHFTELLDRSREFVEASTPPEALR